MTKWDERYRCGDYPSRSPSGLLPRGVAGLPPGRALDLACGAGRHALYLAQLGWQVTAVDSSSVGIEITTGKAAELGLSIDVRIADLEQGEFSIVPAAYDLICDFYYLQRDLMPHVRNGVRAGGMVIAAIHVVDEDPASRLANPAFSLEPGELLQEFSGWNIQYYDEGKPNDKEHKRKTAEIIARKPGEKSSDSRA